MIYLLYIIYACLCGQADAFLYARKGAESLPDNEHKWLVRIRIIAFTLAVAGVGYGMLFGLWGFALVALEGVCIVLAFSFWHNGAYNLMRDRVDGTAHGWRYSSPTDTSDLNFAYPQRRNMLYASIAILFVGYGLYFFVL